MNVPPIACPRANPVIGPNLTPYFQNLFQEFTVVSVQSLDRDKKPYCVYQIILNDFIQHRRELSRRICNEINIFKPGNTKIVSLSCVTGNPTQWVLELGVNCNCPIMPFLCNTNKVCECMTAFMNAVLQCFAETLHLIPTLNEIKNNLEFQLPGDNDTLFLKGSKDLSEELVNALLRIKIKLGKSEAVDKCPLNELMPLGSEILMLNHCSDAMNGQLFGKMLELIRCEDYQRYHGGIVEQASNLIKRESKHFIKAHLELAKGFNFGLDKIFKGELTTVTKCQGCNYSSDSMEKFVALCLPITKVKTINREKNKADCGEITLEECLHQLMARKLRAKCESCTEKGKLEKISIKTVISEAPTILVIILKRFQLFQGKWHKNCKKILVPKTLDLTGFCEDSLADKKKENLILYSLNSVIEQLDYNQYVTYIKFKNILKPEESKQSFSQKGFCKEFLKSDGQANGVFEETTAEKWCKINGSSILEVKEEAFSSQAYLLFYEKCI